MDHDYSITGANLIASGRVPINIMTLSVFFTLPPYWVSAYFDIIETDSALLLTQIPKDYKDKTRSLAN